MSLTRCVRPLLLAALAVFFSTQTRATEFAVSQYGRVTATLPWAVALEKGYFADAGIKIDHIISGEGGGTTLRNMLASDLPYGEVATSAALAAIKSGIDIVIVNTASDHIGEIALVANPKGSIHSVKDLEGKKAGFTNPKSTSELLLRLALKEAGMTGKVEMVGTGGFGGGLTLLDSGGIDAAPLIDPILTLKPDKYRVIFHFADLIPRMTWLVGVTTRKFATEHPEMVRKMIEVHRRGVDYIYAHHDDAIKIYAKIWQQKPDEVATYFPNYFNYKGEWSQGGFDKEALGKMSDGLQLTGEVKWPGRLEGRDRPAVPAQRLAEAALTGRTTGPRRWRISKVGAARTALIVLTFAGLEVLCRIGVLDRVTIIPPTEMVSALWDIVRSGRFNADIAFTLFNTAAAIVLATTVGFFAGALMHVVAALSPGERTADVGLLRHPHLRVLSAAHRHLRRRARRADRHGRDVRHRRHDREHHARARPRATGGGQDRLDHAARRAAPAHSHPSAVGGAASGHRRAAGGRLFGHRHRRRRIHPGNLGHGQAHRLCLRQFRQQEHVRHAAVAARRRHGRQRRRSHCGRTGCTAGSASDEILAPRLSFLRRWPAAAVAARLLGGGR